MRKQTGLISIILGMVVAVPTVSAYSVCDNAPTDGRLDRPDGPRYGVSPYGSNDGLPPDPLMSLEPTNKKRQEIRAEVCGSSDSDESAVDPESNAGTSYTASL